MKHQEEKDDLLINYLSGSANEQERQEALTFIHASEENRNYFDELKKIYQLSLLAAPSSEFNKEEGWARIRGGYYRQLYFGQKQNKQYHIKPMIRQYALPIAASLILAFLMGALVNNIIFNPTSAPVAFNEIKAPYGAKSMLTLPDSTLVWLNAGSKLRYASNFSGNNREVFLEGEAYFDVIKNEKSIFVVNTGDIRVNVYGTQFNVKAYPDEHEIITTLVTGSISIDVSNPNTRKEPLLLKPNQSATFFKAAHDAADKGAGTIKRITVESTEPRFITSWKDSVWVIRGETLGKLAVKLERRFNVNISFEDQGLKDYKFSGSLMEETFEQVMKIIKTSAPINFSVENNHVIIKEDKLFKERYDSLLQRNK